MLFSGKTEGRRTFHGGYLQVKQLVREQNTSFYCGFLCVGCCSLIERGGGRGGEVTAVGIGLLREWQAAVGTGLVR